METLSASSFFRYFVYKWETDEVLLTPTEQKVANVARAFFCLFTACIVPLICRALFYPKTKEEAAQYLSIDFGVYENLKQLRRGAKIVCNGQERAIVGMFGKGGRKQAWDIGNGQALLLPNLSNTPTQAATAWRKTVLAELAGSALLDSMGLMHSALERVTIALPDNPESTIPAYICPSFEALQDRRIYVIDNKVGDSSTWKDKFFETEEHGRTPENWDLILAPLARDVAALSLCDDDSLPYTGDAGNLAVIEEAESPLHVRYFGFDFSSNDGSRWPTRKSASQLRADTPETLKENLRSLFSAALGAEFGSWDVPQDLLVSLVDRHFPTMMAERARLLAAL